MEAIRAIDLGDAGRSFNIQYGNWGFGNFVDYEYDHTFTPTSVNENNETNTDTGETWIFTIDNSEIRVLV